MSRGTIHFQQAYAQGKMLDHGEWTAVLPRGITPSDIDAVFDNRGRMIFLEITSQHTMFSDLSIGQRILHEGLVRDGKHVSVLGWHCVPSSQQINTYSDLAKVSFMFMCNGKPVTLDNLTNFDWHLLVEWWFSQDRDKGADNTIKSLREEYRRKHNC